MTRTSKVYVFSLFFFLFLLSHRSQLQNPHLSAYVHIPPHTPPPPSPLPPALLQTSCNLAPLCASTAEETQLLKQANNQYQSNMHCTVNQQMPSGTSVHNHRSPRDVDKLHNLIHCHSAGLLVECLFGFSQQHRSKQSNSDLPRTDKLGDTWV